MASTYPAILRGDRLEWMEMVPQETAEHESLEVRVTILRTGGARVATEPDSAEDEISRLYDEIASLAAQRDPSAGEPELDRRMETAWSRLRRLQAEEARKFREDFEASLAMPLDAGARILGEAQALRYELENSTSHDPAAGRTDPPSS